MSETNEPAQDNPFFYRIDPDEDSIFRVVREQNALSDEDAVQLNNWRNALLTEGESLLEDEYITRLMKREFGDPRIINGLRKVEAERGIRATELIKHSLRYNEWRNTQKTFEGEYETDAVEKLGFIALAQGSDNLKQDGGLRRHEEGHLISLNAVRRAGIDPSKVLFYRVTQPADNTPKPEYYWTSDSLEVRRGLTYELGRQSKTAIVLASTLEDIAKDGGLIDDMNDDQGHAVRQASLQPYDQSRALFSFPRETK